MAKASRSSDGGYAFGAVLEKGKRTVAGPLPLTLFPPAMNSADPGSEHAIPLPHERKHHAGEQSYCRLTMEFIPPSRNCNLEHLMNA